jgi:hypothetical protein
VFVDGAGIDQKGGNSGGRLWARCSWENGDMATREKRLAQFDGSGEPAPDQPVEVLCEDHSGTYQLPFACRMVEGEWRNHESGITVEATVIGWRLPRVKQSRMAEAQPAVPKYNGRARVS